MELHPGLILFRCGGSRRLLEDLAREFTAGLAPVFDDVFAIEADFLELFGGHNVLGCRGIKLGQPLGIDIEAAGSLGERLAIKVLAFFAEQPIDIDFCRVRLRGVPQHRHGAETVAAAQTFFDIIQRFDRNTGLEVGLDETLRLTQVKGEGSFGDIESASCLPSRLMNNS